MRENENGKFTLEEILSQPATWKESLEQLQRAKLGNFPDVMKYDRVVFTGCGSTHYLSIWACRLLQELGHKNVVSLPGSEAWYSPDDWLAGRPKTLLVAVSRSGETTETIYAVDEFLKKGYGDCVAITCYPDSRLAQRVEHALATPSGRERSVAQTRSFTNMMLSVLALIKREVPADLPSLYEKAALEMIACLRETAFSIGRDPAIERFFFLGDGRLFGLASEVMLKMKEMSLSYSEAYHFLEFRHGPMSMVNEVSLVTGLISSKIRQFEEPVIKDMKKLNAQILIVKDDQTGDFGNAADYTFNLGKDIPSYWLDPFYLPLLQLVAFEHSLSKGLNPDTPKNLTAVVEL
jgi:glucosamine--fructose-6-phosphate aminotransferase (isomerizing)